MAYYQKSTELSGRDRKAPCVQFSNPQTQEQSDRKLEIHVELCVEEIRVSGEWYARRRCIEVSGEEVGIAKQKVHSGGNQEIGDHVQFLA